MQKHHARGCQNDIINVEQHVCRVSAPMEDEQRGIRFGFNKPQGEQISGKPVVPGLGCRLQSIQGLVQVVGQVGVSQISEPYGMTVENGLTEGVVEEGILHIELLNWPVMRDSNSEHHANGGRFHNQAESLIVVDPGALSEPPEDPSSLIAIKGPDGMKLVREDPLAADDVGATGSGDMLPGPIAHQGLYSSSITACPDRSHD
jgi:hypothetical protein